MSKTREIVEMLGVVIGILSIFTAMVFGLGMATRHPIMGGILLALGAISIIGLSMILVRTLNSS